MFKPGKKSYDEQQVLNDISFEIKKGEFFGIVGRNGSGKSTLLKLLAGIYSPDEGEVQVNGKLTPFIELGVGFNQELSGRENVFLNGALLGFSRTEMAKMYDEIVKFAELEDHMDVKLKNFSSGMQVRLAFSIAVRANSDILLIDEVLAVGDSAFQQKCYNFFEQLKSKKKTIVFVSHDMDAVQRFCTKALFIKEGVIVKIGNTQDVASLYKKENILIDNPKKEKTQKDDSKKEASIETSITGQGADYVEFTITNKSKFEYDTYVGFSISQNGISVAELNNKNGPRFTKSKLGFRVDTTVFNAGHYQIGVALFKAENRQILAITEKMASFEVKGYDETRGGSLRLKDTWLTDV